MGTKMNELITTVDHDYKDKLWFHCHLCTRFGKVCFFVIILMWIQ